MSNSVNLAKLKSKIEVYESEYQQAFVALTTAPKGWVSPSKEQIAALDRFFDLSGKLLKAYREYTSELEK